MNNVVSWLLSFVKRKGFLYTTGTILGLFILFNYILLPAYVNHGGTLAVPNVVGMPLAQAKEVLDAAGLQPIEADTRPDPEKPLGTVISQNPIGADQVKHGRRVYLSVSGGEVPVPVPALRGRSMRDARFSLDRFGLKLGGVSYATSETFPQNTIIDQTVAPGSMVSRGTSVGILVSSGKDMQRITVPSLTGKSTTEAERLLMEAGLKVGNITLQPSFELLPNTVVDQFPRGGEQVQLGQAVDLFVVKAGKPAEEIHVPKE